MKIKSVVTIGVALLLCLCACSDRGGEQGALSSPSSQIVEENGGSRIFLQDIEAESPQLPIGPSKQELEEATAYILEESPFFAISFENIEKIYFYNAAMGVDTATTDLQRIEKMVSLCRTMQFYDKTPPESPSEELLSHNCLYYFEFYRHAEDETPAFCMGLDPFYIQVENTKFGPYALLSDSFIPDLLMLFAES